jgi:hypothetical protein
MTHEDYYRRAFIAAGEAMTDDSSAHDYLYAARQAERAGLLREAEQMAIKAARAARDFSETEKVARQMIARLADEQAYRERWEVAA